MTAPSLTRLLTVAAGTILSAAIAAPAFAQSTRPGDTVETVVRGRVISFDGRRNLTIYDVRGYVDRITVDGDTVIDPSGLELVRGTWVRIAGVPRGSSLLAFEIDRGGGAETAGAAAAPRTPERSAQAPADEYFGTLKLSVIGIQNMLRDESARLDGTSYRDPGSVVRHVALIEASIRDWAAKYPADTWLPRTLFALQEVYAKVGTAEARQRAAEVASWLNARYPASAEAPLLQPLRRVEYLMTYAVDGREQRSRLLLDVIDTMPDDRITVGVTENDRSLLLDLGNDGTIVSPETAEMSPEAALLVRFFALGGQNLTGLDPGERWSAGGTEYRVVAVRDGRFEIGFARESSPFEGAEACRGELLYDVQKVIPIAFDAQMPRVRMTAKLVSDSQP